MLVFGKYAITVITSPNHWQSTARTPSGREGTADSARCQLKVLTLFSGIFLSLSLTGTPVKDTLAATTRFDPSHAPVFASPEIANRGLYFAVWASPRFAWICPRSRYRLSAEGTSGPRRLTKYHKNCVHRALTVSLKKIA